MSLLLSYLGSLRIEIWSYLTRSMKDVINGANVAQICLTAWVTTDGTFRLPEMQCQNRRITEFTEALYISVKKWMPFQL